ncbi:hypothetical protein HPB48_001488 [Haemaphysalis longicornis]|uniref:CCHC-type domain-containing protein n=1 Tax=Haemaphysalis longicornis TaxID=44386 RepID=A0A9J6FF66_HAELO|nr:hypothetical protein HPB48_001488 [Haemaphysalis longicornis]
MFSVQCSATSSPEGASAPNRSSAPPEVPAARTGYRTLLPTLPTGKLSENSVFLHGDPSARPYKIDDVAVALSAVTDLKKITGLGPFQFNHVWMVTFQSPEEMKELASKGKSRQKGKKEKTVKLHWVPTTVPNELLVHHLERFGVVKSVSFEKWRRPNMDHMGSTTRVVQIVTIYGNLVLIEVPGRPAMCLRCQLRGHMRRQCTTPWCRVCRTFVARQRCTLDTAAGRREVSPTCHWRMTEPQTPPAPFFKTAAGTEQEQAAEGENEQETSRRRKERGAGAHQRPVPLHLSSQPGSTSREKSRKHDVRHEPSKPPPPQTVRRGRGPPQKTHHREFLNSSGGEQKTAPAQDGRTASPTGCADTTPRDNGSGGASAPGDPLAEPGVEDVNAAPAEQQSTSQNDPTPVAPCVTAGDGDGDDPEATVKRPRVEDVNAAPAEQQSTSQNDPTPVAPVLDAKSEECVGAGPTNTALTREVRDAGDGDGDDPEATVKRPRKEDDKREDSGDSGNVKASVGGVMLRRPSFKPKPNTTPYDRGHATGKPP